MDDIEQIEVPAPRLAPWVIWVAATITVVGLPVLVLGLRRMSATPFEYFVTPILTAAVMISLWMAVHWREWRALPVSLMTAILLTRVVVGIFYRSGSPTRTAPIMLLEDMLMWAAAPIGFAAIAYLWRIFENQARFQAAQQALSENARQYRHFVENATDAALTADADGRICLVNPGAAHLFGRRRSDLVGADYFNIVPKEAGDEVRKALAGQERQKAAAFYHEFSISVREGRARWVGENVQAVIEGGRLAGFQAVLRDVTGRRSAEEALRQSEGRLRSLFDTMSEGVVRTAPNGRVVFENPAADAIFGVPRDGLRNETLSEGSWEFLRVDGTPMPIGEWADHRARQEKQAVQHVVTGLRHRDGRTVWLNASAVPLVSGGGELEGAVLTLTDVSEKKAAEEDLRIVEFALDSAREAVFLVTRQGQIIYANKQAMTALGYTAAELAKLLVFDIDTQLSPEDWAETWRHAEGGEWPSYESEHLRKDGNTFPTMTTASYFEYQGAGYIFAFVHDVSRENELAAQLRQAQKMEAIGTLAGGIAHDFNNILTAILGYNELAMQDVPEDGTAARSLQQVRKAADRAADMVQQILTFSRRREQKQQPLRVAPVVKEAVKLLRGSLPATIEVDARISEDTGPVMADPAQIHQVVMNLCTNAYHAMQEKGGKLKVELADANVTREEAARHLGLKPGSYVKLSVADTGCGMDEATQQRMFEPFFTTKREGKGTGLGLATVHGIIRSHKGTVRVESRQDEGTCIDIFFPVCGESGKQEEPEVVEGPAQTGDECVMLVDDEKPIVDSLGMGLERLGYTVEGHTSAEEAIESFMRDPSRYHLVATDQMMPGMAGVELSSRLHRIREDLPILIYTGFYDSVPRIAAEAVGVIEILKKPISARALSAAIRRALDGEQSG